MRKIYAIGESLIDIIFNEGEVKAAKAGGSMLNSAVSLGRAGLDMVFLSEFGNDLAGTFVADFLEKNGVTTTYIHRYNQGKTPLALAFLNEKGDASYDFYKLYPKERLQLQMPVFQQDDIFLFGSFFGLDPAVRSPLLKIVEQARASGTIIVYDPNFRKPHAHQLEELLPVILENMELASIIKASNEDLELIFGHSDPAQLINIPQLQNKPLVITQGAKGARLISSWLDSTYAVRKIEVVSTIGAGDNFNAGLIYGLVKENVTIQNLSRLNTGQWGKIIGLAMAFASNVCQSYDNYISPDFAKTLPQRT